VAKINSRAEIKMLR